MEKEEIQNVIQDILVNDGPDGHCDGSDIITDFVIAILKGTAKEWVEDYFKNDNKRKLFTN